MLYTVNTGNGRLTMKKDLDPPPFPGDTPSSARCPNRSWKYANETFQTDRETLVYATGTGELYRFVVNSLDGRDAAQRRPTLTSDGHRHGIGDDADRCQDGYKEELAGCIVRNQLVNR